MPGRIGALALAVALGACATKRDLLDLQTEIRGLDAKQDSAFADLARAVQQGNRQALDSVAAASEFVFDFRGDLSNQLREIQQGLLVTRNIVGENQHALALLLEEWATARREIQELTRRVEQLSADSAGVDAGGGSAASTIVPVGVPGQAEEDFGVATRQLEDMNYTVARMAFESFIAEHPGSELAPAAHLHLGELLSGEQRFQDAVDIYLRVPEAYPEADEAPQALFRAGVLYLEKLDDAGQARTLLQQVVDTYPDHSVAEQARARLGEIP